MKNDVVFVLKHVTINHLSRSAAATLCLPEANRARRKIPPRDDVAPGACPWDFLETFDGSLDATRLWQSSVQND